MLIGLGFIHDPIDFLGADVALYAGLTYAYLLIMMFPLYNAIEALDRNQIEAARDLGAPWWHIHLFVVMPYAKPGIASGATLVFMLCAGALAAPLVLGGPKTLWFTPIVYDRFFQAFNWPQGAAYALILLAACMVFVLIVMRLFKRQPVGDRAMSSRGHFPADDRLLFRCCSSASCSDRWWSWASPPSTRRPIRRSGRSRASRSTGSSNSSTTAT